MQSEIEEKGKRIRTHNEKIEMLRKFAMCVVCEQEFYDWILPCGHLICVMCRDRIESQYMKCGARVHKSDAIKLNFIF